MVSLNTEARCSDDRSERCLKEAYFHIQIVQRHRQILTLAFKGKAVFPCKLSDSFTKSMTQHKPIWGSRASAS